MVGFGGGVNISTSALIEIFSLRYSSGLSKIDRARSLIDEAE